MVIDDEMISSIRRTMRGIEVSDDTISADLIDQTARGIGHFLGADQTMSLMEGEYVYPILGDRLSPDDWSENGSHDIWYKASEQVKTILSQPEPDHISAQADAAVCAKYPIRMG